jgi:hypothetical protein
MKMQAMGVYKLADDTERFQILDLKYLLEPRLNYYLRRSL